MATTTAATASNSVSNLPLEVQQALQGVTMKANKQTLNQDDFLRLLTVQLQNQDPLKPMEDAQFMGQMAQFASLEQTKELTSTVNALSTALGFSSAQQFLGKNVTVDSDGVDVSGTVSGVVMEDGLPKVLVNDKTYGTNLITSVTLAQ
jgi:flagellar basal-body rod modification protein FlgD